MAEPTVLFVKPGAIKPNDKGRLYKAGVIVVEVEDPQAVNFVRPRSAVPIEELSHGALLRAAAEAIIKTGTTNFGLAVAQALLRTHKPPDDGVGSE